uniref:Uncharacterized protein n=1 Tax=Cacopsylla melanoneura TaxID=428564 RepID=A0A8D9EPI2_9HEMI
MIGKRSVIFFPVMSGNNFPSQWTTTCCKFVFLNRSFIIPARSSLTSCLHLCMEVRLITKSSAFTPNASAVAINKCTASRSLIWHLSKTATNFSVTMFLFPRRVSFEGTVDVP